MKPPHALLEAYRSSSQRSERLGMGGLSALWPQLHLAAGRSSPAAAASACCQQVGDLTLLELSKYNGRDPMRPLLLAVRGRVFDVTTGRAFYGPGMAQAGCACSAAVLQQTGARPVLRHSAARSMPLLAGLPCVPAPMCMPYATLC